MHNEKRKGDRSQEQPCQRSWAIIGGDWEGHTSFGKERGKENIYRESRNHRSKLTLISAWQKAINLCVFMRDTNKTTN